MELKGKLASLPPFSVRQEANEPQDRVQFDHSSAASPPAGTQESSDPAPANAFVLEKSSRKNDETSLGEHLILPAIVGIAATALCVGVVRYVHGLISNGSSGKKGGAGSSAAQDEPGSAQAEKSGQTQVLSVEEEVVPQEPQGGRDQSGAKEATAVA